MKVIWNILLTEKTTFPPPHWARNWVKMARIRWEMWVFEVISQRGREGRENFSIFIYNLPFQKTYFYSICANFNHNLCSRGFNFNQYFAKGGRSPPPYLRHCLVVKYMLGGQNQERP